MRSEGTQHISAVLHVSRYTAWRGSQHIISSTARHTAHGCAICHAHAWHNSSCMHSIAVRQSGNAKSRSAVTICSPNCSASQRTVKRTSSIINVYSITVHTVFIISSMVNLCLHSYWLKQEVKKPSHTPCLNCHVVSTCSPSWSKEREMLPTSSQKGLSRVGHERHQLMCRPAYK